MRTQYLWWIAFMQCIAVVVGFVALDQRAFPRFKSKQFAPWLRLQRVRAPTAAFMQHSSLPAKQQTPLPACTNLAPCILQQQRRRLSLTQLLARFKQPEEQPEEQPCDDYDYDNDDDDYDDYEGDNNCGSDYEYDSDDEHEYEEDEEDDEEEEDEGMRWNAFDDVDEEYDNESEYGEDRETEDVNGREQVKREYPSTVRRRSREEGAWDDEEEIPDTAMAGDLKYLNASLANAFGNNAVVLGEEGKVAESLPIIAVIGRPNVGKSTVVNRLSGKHRHGAIVYDEPGVTRDRSYHVGRYKGYYFQIVDTGGILFNDKAGEIFARHIREQADLAIEDCSVVLFVTDVREGITELDKQIARYLKTKGKPVVLVVNKAEGRWGEAQKFVRLGMGHPYPISGVHGVGLADVMDLVTHKYLEQISVLISDERVNVAVVGRPNVGKSSLFNRLNGQNRSIVSDVAGTTRDSIDTTITYNGRRYQIVDTAGVRKKKSIPKGTEYLMVNRALKALARSDVTLLVIDALEGVTEQDRVLAKRVALDGRACVIVLNKWDAVPDKDEKMYDQGVKYVREQLPELAWAEVLMVSAVTGQRCMKIFEAIDRAHESHNRRYSTSVINNVLKDALLWEPPPAISSGGGTGRIYYATQVATAPPTIAMFCNSPNRVPDSYKRYLERRFREALRFEGTPLRFRWRARTVRATERISRHKLRPE